MGVLGTFPRPLGWLAVTWLMLGVLSLLGLTRLRADIGLGPFNVGLLGILFGPGLFLAQPWARKCLIWFTRLGFVLMALFTLGVLGKAGPAFWVGLAVAVLVSLLLMIQRDVLLRPDVQRFFDPYGRIE
jgi:hypothetical protein